MVSKKKAQDIYTTVENGELVVHDKMEEIAAKHLPAPMPQELIEAWKKAPKEQALKEAIELYRAQGIDVSEARFKLDVLRFISELQGAQAPVSAGGQIISIIIGSPSIPEKRIINVTPTVVEAQEEKKKEDALH